MYMLFVVIYCMFRFRVFIMIKFENIFFIGIKNEKI